MSLRRHVLYELLFALLIALSLLWAVRAWGQGTGTVDATQCWVHPDQVWQVEVTVSGIPVDVIPYTVQNNTSIPGVMRCVDLAGLEEPYTFGCRTFNADGSTDCVLPDGSQGPLRVYSWRRADLSENGIVDLPDISRLLSELGRTGP